MSRRFSFGDANWKEKKNTKQKLAVISSVGGNKRENSENQRCLAVLCRRSRRAGRRWRNGRRPVAGLPVRASIFRHRRRRRRWPTATMKRPPFRLKPDRMFTVRRRPSITLVSAAPADTFRLSQDCRLTCQRPPTRFCRPGAYSCVLNTMWNPPVILTDF